MAQGQIKKSKVAPLKLSQRKQSGSRIIKPKKANAIKQEKMKKKHSAGLASMTEKSLATKAGHLEMLSGGKKDAKAAKMQAKAAKSK